MVPFLTNEIILITLAEQGTLIGYKGPPLGATGNNDKDKKDDNSVFWTVLTFIAGFVVFEIVISHDGFHFKAQSKSKKGS